MRKKLKKSLYIPGQSIDMFVNKQKNEEINEPDDEYL